MKADAQLTLFAEAFLNLASLSPLPGSSEAKTMTVTSGRRCLELYPKSDPLGSSVRMCLESLSWHSIMCYLTWKTSATPAKRLIFQLAPSMPRTKGKGCGLWRTPEAMDCANRKFARNSRGEPKLSAQVKAPGFWPTPSTPRPHDNEKTVGKYMMSQNQKDLTIAAKNGGQLNPDWVDTMMGFPAGWSEPDCDEPQELPFPAPMGCEQYEWEPPLVATNCPNRANRLKADGNAVVPQIPEIFGRLIIAVEGGVNP